jgi:hypothetical protein
LGKGGRGNGLFHFVTVSAFFLHVIYSYLGYAGGGVLGGLSSLGFGYFLLTVMGCVSTIVFANSIVYLIPPHNVMELWGIYRFDGRPFKDNDNSEKDNICCALTFQSRCTILD